MRHDEIHDNILKNLPQNNKISVALDCWTSPNRQSYMGITGYYIDDNWKYNEVLLGFEVVPGKHDGEGLSRVLERVVMEHGLEGRIATVTTDNASNNSAMLRYFSLSPAGEGFDPHYDHMPCIAHVIQLALGKLVEGIKITATNDEIIKNWDDTHFRKLGNLTGMALTLEKVLRQFFQQRLYLRLIKSLVDSITCHLHQC